MLNRSPAPLNFSWRGDGQEKSGKWSPLSAFREEAAAAEPLGPGLRMASNTIGTPSQGWGGNRGKRRNWKVGQLEDGCRREQELAFAQDGRGGLDPHSSN